MKIVLELYSYDDGYGEYFNITDFKDYKETPKLSNKYSNLDYSEKTLKQFLKEVKFQDNINYNCLDIKYIDNTCLNKKVRLDLEESKILDFKVFPAEYYGDTQLFVFTLEVNSILNIEDFLYPTKQMIQEDKDMNVLIKIEKDYSDLLKRVQGGKKYTDKIKLLITSINNNIKLADNIDITLYKNNGLIKKRLSYVDKIKPKFNEIVYKTRKW